MPAGGAMRTAALLLALSAAGAASAACRLEVGELSLGAIDSREPRTDRRGGHGPLALRRAVGSLQIALLRDAGPHQLLHAGDSLAYQIFLDAGRTIAWGDGTAGTQVAIVSGASASCPSTAACRPDSARGQALISISWW